MPWRSVLYCTVLLDLTVYLPRTTGRPTTNAQIIISGRNLHSDVIVLRWIPQTNDQDRPGRLSVRERAHRNNKSAVVGRHAARSNPGIPRNDDNLTGTNDGRRTEIAWRAHYVTSRAEAAPRQPLNPTIYKLLIMRDGRLPLANKIIISSSVLAARRHRKGRFLLTSWMLMLMLSLKVWWSDKSFRLFCSKCFMWHFDVNRFLCSMSGVFVRFMRVVNASFVVRRRFVGDTVNKCPKLVGRRPRHRSLSVCGDLHPSLIRAWFLLPAGVCPNPKNQVKFGWVIFNSVPVCRNADV